MTIDPELKKAIADLAWEIGVQSYDDGQEDLLESLEVTNMLSHETAAEIRRYLKSPHPHQDQLKQRLMAHFDRL